MTKAGPGHSWELGIPSWSPTWVAEGQALGPFSAASPRALARSRIRSGAAGTWAGTHLGCQHHKQWLNALYHVASTLQMFPRLQKLTMVTWPGCRVGYWIWLKKLLPVIPIGCCHGADLCSLAGNGICYCFVLPQAATSSGFSRKGLKAQPPNLCSDYTLERSPSHVGCVWPLCQFLVIGGKMATS